MSAPTTTLRPDGHSDAPAAAFDNSRSQHFILIAAAVASLSVFAHVWAHLFFFEPDSVSYVSIADNLLHGHGYRTFEGDWCAAWPPLVPLLLALGQKAGLPQPYPFAIINAASVGAIVWLAGQWLMRLTSNTQVTIGSLAIAIVSPSLLAVANAGYTEALFTALVLGALTSLDRHVATRSMAALAFAALFTALALLTRYIGVALVATAVIALLASRDRPLGRRIVNAAAFVALSCGPLIAWCWSNYRHTGTYTGPRSAPELAFGANIGHTILFTLLWVGGGIALAGLWTLIFRRPIDENSLAQVANRRLLIFPAIYITVLVVSASLVDVDPPDNRLLAPAFVPVLIWLVAEAWQNARRTPQLRRRFWVTLALWSVFNVVCAPFLPRSGFLDTRWAQSGLVAAIARTSPAVPLYSNDAAACYFLAHRNAHSTLDDGDRPSDRELKAALIDLGDGSLIAWFNQGLLDERVTAQQVAHCPVLEVVRKCNDGVLYRVHDPNP